MNFDILPQLLWNGFVSGSLYALLALGLSLIYGVLLFNNLAHGEMAMLGGYFFLTFQQTLGWPLIPAFFAAVLTVVIIGVIIGYLTFLPVKDAFFLIPLIISIGVGLILKNLILLIFGPNVYSLSADIQTHHLFGEKIIYTDTHIAILVLTALCFAFLYFFLKKTKIGKAIRAVSDNKEVASIMGIDVKKTIMAVFIIAMAMAAIAGIMFGFDQNVNPSSGTMLTIKSFAAVMLGGLGSIPGSILGAFFIGFAENLLIGIPFGDFYIPSGYKDAIAFVALILILYLRPRGLLGEAQSETVRK